MSRELRQDVRSEPLAARDSEDTLPSPASTDSAWQEKPVESQAEPKIEAPARITANMAGAIPDGGLVAWLQVLGAFMLFFNSWGLLNTFGVFQTYYESGALFSKSSSDIAWIGSIQSYLLLTIGFFSGPMYDKGYLRTLLATGSFLIVFGLMMLSLCTTYWQVLLSQGFCVGIGAGCLFVPSVAILPSYFSTKLGLIIGLAAAGSSFGGVIYPIVLYRLIDQIGFGWSVRVLGFIALGTLLVPLAVMKMRVTPPKARALIDWSAFTDAHFMLFTVATLVGFIGLFVLVFYLSFFALDRGLTDTAMAFYIVPIYNAASCLGRTLPNALSDRTGALNLITPGALVVAVLTFCVVAVESEAAVILVAVLAGFFSGVFIALPPVCFVALTQDKSKIGTRVGMGYGIIAFSALAGGAGGGSVLGVTDPLDWQGLWIYGGVAASVGGLLYAVLRVAKYGFKLNVKA